MKKVFITLLIAAVFVLMFGLVFTKISNDSSGSGTSQTEQESMVGESPTLQKEPIDLANRIGRELKEPTEAAQQILVDISDAEVEESTEDLKITFDRLNKICERAVETCDAMLAAKYDNKQEHTANDEKGAENGNE